MPLTRISLRVGKPADWRRAIMKQLYRAMRETFNVPEGDRFMLIHEHDADDLDYGPEYLGIKRSADLVIIQITANNTCTVAQKKALFERVAELLAEDPGIRPEDVFINLVEVPRENWSFGHGVAQYA